MKAKLVASSWHLLISLIVASILFGLFYFVWYPFPLFKAIGGDSIFLLLLAVDVTLGPLLTAVVYRKGKRTLKFDLTVIAALQLCALAYGVATLLVARPVFIAALGHRFDLIQANEVNVSGASSKSARLSFTGPIIVGTKTPTDPKEREEFMFGGDDLGNFPKHHQPIENMRDEILKNSQPISDLRKFNSTESEEIERWLKQHDVTEDAVRYQGLRARSMDMAVIFDATTGRVIGIAPFRPWQ